MILSAQSIRKLCTNHEVWVPQHGVLLTPNDNPMLSPFHEKTIFEGMSFGLSCAGYDIRIAEDVELWPGDFKLSFAIEKFKMPNNVLGIVHDKSSWARKGLSVFNTVIEPGWEGYLTLELKNQNPLHKYEKTIYGSYPIAIHTLPLTIKAGSPIAQVVFHWLDENTDTPYTGKYQNQANKAVAAINEGDTNA